jgi:hypothetical protein
LLKFVFIPILALTTSAAAQSSLQRGDYLVNAVMACDGCHTPRDSSGFVMEKRFSGGSQTWDVPEYTVKGSNITPDPDTGIGRWSETDIKISLTEGLRPYGMPLAPQMPFAFYKIMTPGDLEAVVTYLRMQFSPPSIGRRQSSKLFPVQINLSTRAPCGILFGAGFTLPPSRTAWSATHVVPMASRIFRIGLARVDTK